MSSRLLHDEHLKRFQDKKRVPSPAIAETVGFTKKYKKVIKCSSTPKNFFVYGGEYAPRTSNSTGTTIWASFWSKSYSNCQSLIFIRGLVWMVAI